MSLITAGCGPEAPYRTPTQSEAIEKAVSPFCAEADEVGRRGCFAVAEVVRMDDGKLKRSTILVVALNIDNSLEVVWRPDGVNISQLTPGGYMNPDLKLVSVYSPSDPEAEPLIERFKSQRM